MGKQRRKIAVMGIALAMLVVLVPSALAAPSTGNGNGKGTGNGNTNTTVPDLSVSMKEDTSDPAHVGDTITYTVTVANSGATAVNVLLDVWASSGGDKVIALGGSSADGSCSVDRNANSGDTWCSWSSVGASPKTATFSWRAIGLGSITFEADVLSRLSYTAVAPDRNWADNKASATTVVNVLAGN